MSAPKAYEVQLTASITIVVENAIDEQAAINAAIMDCDSSWNIEDQEAHELIGPEKLATAKRHSDRNLK